MDKRKMVKRRISKTFNRLIYEMFPTFIDPDEDEDSIPTPTHSTPTPTATSPSLVTPTTHDEAPDEITEDHSDTSIDPTTMSQLSLESLPVATNLHRSRFQDATVSEAQDLYETPTNALHLLDTFLGQIPGQVVFEPCYGRGAITSYLQENGINVISRDLFTMEEKHDYLTAEAPEYDVLITNPRVLFLPSLFGSTNLLVGSGYKSRFSFANSV